MQAGNNLGLIECEADSGTHGAGAAAGADPFAMKGSTLVAYTSDPDQEIDWSGNGISDAVTFYDGNYLNYRAVPVLVMARKIDIVKGVATTVMNSISDVNVGVMRFNDNRGGPVIQDIVDLNCESHGHTSPLLTASSLAVEHRCRRLCTSRPGSGVVCRRITVELVNEHPTDPGALASTGPEVYNGPPCSPASRTTTCC